jgi:hypothetical protein
MEKVLETYSELLRKFAELPKEEKEMTFLELCHYPGERFEEICSRILEFFFQPNNKHGFRDLWFKSLCKIIKIDCEDVFEMKTRTEEATSSSEKEKGKKIDIVLETPTLVIAIENKIGADLYNPLDIYKEHIDKGYSKLNKKCIVLTAHRLSNEEQKKANENGFVVVLYKKLFDNVRELLGKYVSSCNPNFLSFMLDFMMTVEKRMNFMDNTELNRFFFDKKEEIESMLNSFGDWQRKLRDEQSCELNKIKDVITKKTKCLWWIYQGWDLGVHFLDKTQYKIGIESEFEPTKDDPIGEFKIYITTWNIECWKWYKDSVLKKYPNCFLDEGTINTKNRVYYHMPVIKRTDFRENDYINEIVKRLEEYFLFLKQESKKYMR